MKKLTDKQIFDKLMEKAYPIRYIYMADLEDDLSVHIEGYEKLSYKEKTKLLKNHIKEYVAKVTEALDETVEIESFKELFNGIIEDAVTEMFDEDK